jgi:hypothetical protein
MDDRHIRNSYYILIGKPKAKSPLRKYKTFLKILFERLLTGFIWLRAERSPGYCESGNEHSVSIKTRISEKGILGVQYRSSDVIKITK